VLYKSWTTRTSTNIRYKNLPCSLHTAWSLKFNYLLLLWGGGGYRWRRPKTYQSVLSPRSTGMVRDHGQNLVTSPMTDLTLRRTDRPSTRCTVTWAWIWKPFRRTHRFRMRSRRKPMYQCGRHFVDTLAHSRHAGLLSKWQKSCTAITRATTLLGRFWKCNSMWFIAEAKVIHWKQA
jgi:hypothetical protein